jgi:hypothetical protein
MMIEVKPEIVATWPAAIVRRLDQGERILAIIFMRKGEQGQTSYPMFVRAISPGHYGLERPEDLVALNQETDLVSSAKDVPRAGGAK